MLKSISDAHSLRNGLNGLLIHGSEFRHELEHMPEQLARNSHNSFQGVTEDDISLNAF